MVDPVQVTATVTIDRQPAIGSYMQVTISGGTTGSGDVYVTGIDHNGHSTTSHLTFHENAVRVTTKRFVSITSITTTDFTDEATIPQIRVEAVSGDGVANLISYQIAASRPVAFGFQGKKDYPALNQGTHEMDGGRVLIDWEEVWNPRVDDIATDDQLGGQWVVLAVRPITLGFGYRPSHFELSVKRYTT